MRYLRSYKVLTRHPLKSETIAIGSVVADLKRRSTYKLICYICQIALVVVISSWSISIISKLTATWFNIILWFAFALMLAHLILSFASRYVNMLRSIDMIVSGEYSVVRGKAMECKTIMFGRCLVDGIVGDGKTARIQFRIDRDFVNQNNNNRTFICFMTNTTAYVLATLSNGAKLVSDSVDLYKISTRSASN